LTSPPRNQIGIRWELEFIEFAFHKHIIAMPETEKTWGSGGLYGNRVLGSLILTVLPPAFCLMFWYTCFHLEGSFEKLYAEIASKGYMFVYHMWPSPTDPVALKLVGGFSVFNLFLMRFVPGKKFEAMATATGHIPVYIENGIQCYIINVLALVALVYNGYDIGIVYDKLGNILSTNNSIALTLCAFLVFKGLYFPSTKDNGDNGSFIVNFFWGTELYPRIFGFDVKQFTNCRFGMMYWQVGILCYAYRQYTDNGFVSSSMFVSVLLQSIYICKFFVWETGYFCSMDIQHDRAGYYLCWGCMVWVPSMYTMHTYFLTKHPILLSIPTTVLFVVAGIACIWCNYDCDRYVCLSSYFF
jgi:7-dehydrocholesterol reductase